MDADPAVTGPMRSRGAGLVLRGVLCVLLIVLLWRLTDGREVMARLSDLRWPWVIAALAAAHGQIVLSALRWRLTAAQLGQRIGLSECLREYYLSQLINFSVPGGILGDAGRAVRQRHRGGIILAGQAVVIERMAGQIALFAVMAAGFGAASIWPGKLVLPNWAHDFAFWVAGLAAALLIVLALLAFLPGRVARGLSSFLRSARVALAAPGMWPVQVALSLSIVGCNLASLGFASLATGTPVPVAAVVTILPLVLTSMLIPLSVGGWGPREGAAAALWPVFGASAAAGVAASVAFGLIIWMACLPGLWVIFSRRPIRTQEPSPPVQ